MDKLAYLIDEYSEKKKEADRAKKEVDKLNLQIKEFLEDIGLDEYSSESFTVIRSVINTDKIDEDKLIEKLSNILTEEQREEVIKTKLYIDLDSLENLVYNRTIDADVIDECIIHNKPTVRLNIRKRKDEEENG